MIILDTNTLYYLSGIELSEKVNIIALEKFITKEHCVCSLYSFFEILKSSFTFEKKNKVIKYMISHQITINANDYINDKIKDLGKIDLYSEEYCNKLLIIYGETVINQISANLSFFVKAYTYQTATIFLDNYERGLSKEKKYFRSNFEFYQKDIDKHIFKIVKANLNKLLIENRFTTDNIKVVLTLMVANLMTYYYELLKEAKILFESKNNYSYYKLIKSFKKLQKLILKDNLMDVIDFEQKYLSVTKIIIENCSEEKSTSIPKLVDVENYLKCKLIESVYLVDENMRNEFEEKWLERNIQSLFIKSANIKPNDFIDYEILKELYYNDEYSKIITFDNKMYKIMLEVNSCSKFIESIKLIDSLKSNKSNG